MVIDWGKIALVALVVVTTSVLGAIGTISGETVTAVLGAATGYVFGNGKAAVRHQAPQPMFSAGPVELARPTTGTGELVDEHQVEGQG